MNLTINIKRLIMMAVIVVMALPAVALAETATYVYDDVERLNETFTQ